MSINSILQPTSGLKIVDGEGCWLKDSNGKKYLDFIAGIGVSSTGHCHPEVVRAVNAQSKSLLHISASLGLTSALEQLLKELESILPKQHDRIFLGTTGSEAVEQAIRLALHYTGRPGVLCFDGAYHGRTAGAMSLTTSTSRVRSGSLALTLPFVVSPFPNEFYYNTKYGWTSEQTIEFAIEEFKKNFLTKTTTTDCGAIIVEPVQGEGGYNIASPVFLKFLRSFCDEHKMLLILDEIQTGNGRTGEYWASEHSGVVPDLLITAKGLASGLPLSLVSGEAKIFESAAKGSIGGTFGSNPIACAAGAATIKIIREENLVENARSRGKELLDKLNATVGKTIKGLNVRGLGLMVAVDLSETGIDAKEVVRECMEYGLIVGAMGPTKSILRLAPPLVISSEEVDTGVGILSKILLDKMAKS